MQQDLVGLAFAAGMVAALNPCGFAMLPAYLALVVRGEHTRQRVAVGRALAATAAMALGFLAVFSTFGLLAVSVASTLQRYLPFVTVLIGIVLVALGIWLLLGRKLAILNPFAHGHIWEPTTRIGSMFGYGVGYAIASLSCTVGPFLAVTGATFRGGPVLDGLVIYLAYGAGLTLIVGVLAVAVAFARSALVLRMRRIALYTNAISGVLLVLVGLYVGYYGVYEVRLFNANGNPRDPVIAGAGRLVQGPLAQWVHQHGAWPWVLTLAVLVALTLVAWVWRKRRRLPGSRPRETSAAPLLFSYGTLRQRDVQLTTFGRELDGRVDAIVGYELDYVTINNPHVITASGSDRHPILKPTDRPGAEIEGRVFEITEAELAAADKYEVDDYRRVSVPLRSGQHAWVYVFAG